VAELAVLIPENGGAYAFALHSLSPFWGFQVGLAETIKILATIAAITSSIASYILEPFESREDSIGAFHHLIIWAGCLILFFLLNSAGVKTTSIVQTSFTIFAVLLLGIFFIGSVFVMDFEKYAVGDGWFPNGFSGVLEGVPFVMWLFLGIEELPLSAREISKNPAMIPRAITASMITLAILATLTVFLNCSVQPGTSLLAVNNSPILAGFQAIFGTTGPTIYAFQVAVIFGLFCSLHSFINFSGQIILSMSNDSFYPTYLRYQHPETETPINALGFASISSLTILCILYGIFGEEKCASILVSVALLAAMISYIIQFVAYIQLKKSVCARVMTTEDQGKSNQHSENFYQSPFGLAGAYVGIFFALLLLVCLFFLASSQWQYAAGLIFVSLVFLLGALHFYFKLSTGLKDASNFR